MTKNSKTLIMFFMVICFLLLVSTPKAALAANDPGHDTLYILRTGDNVSGTFNYSGTTYVKTPTTGPEAANKAYVDSVSGSGPLIKLKKK